MDASLPDRPGVGQGFVSRRWLLRLAGGTGLAAVVGACSTPPPAASPAPHPTAIPANVAPLSSPTPSPPTEPAAAPPPVGPAVTSGQLCREAWGAQPARAGGIPHTPARMTIHHTATVLGDNSNIIERLRQHQRYHQNQLGWIDIAYHLGVDRHGNIYELRDPQIKGDTATNYDPTGHFLVVLEGDFDQETVTDAQLDGAARAFAWAAQQFGIPTDTLAGHRDVSHDTACPGANLYAAVSSGDLKRRIDSHVAAGLVDLPIVCLPEAEQLVAAIQAGM